MEEEVVSQNPHFYSIFELILIFTTPEVFKLAFAILYWAAKKFRVGREVVKEMNGKWITNSADNFC
jgi:hypothetical protein